MNSTIPSLPLDGWIENKHLQMRKLWEYFMTSEYSQSNTFYGDIASLKYILAISNPRTNLVTNLESALGRLYSKYFDKVNPDVTIDGSQDDKWIVKIAITCIDDNTSYYLNRELTYSNGKIEKYEQLLDELYDQYTKS